MIGLLRRWRAHREARVLARRAIPDALWALTLARFPFLARRATEDLVGLRRLCALFLDRKEFTGAGGLAVDDAMAVAIAAQACLPVLRFGLGAYDGFVGIVVHPDEVVARREVVDEDGIVHAYDEVLAGEAMAGGPVMLSWTDVAQAGAPDAGGYNVVIHEFAHVLDMGDGLSDGVPPLDGGLSRQAWLDVLMPSFDHFSERVVCGHDTLLDPYGATGVDEFFAVSAEAFFVTPLAMRAEHPDWYALLARYFRQDPAEFAAD